MVPDMISRDEAVRAAAGVTFDRPIVMNVYRSILVEAIVAAALTGWEWCSADYASHDFRHRDGTRLEVKQAAARQTWFTGKPSRTVWDIAPRTGFWVDGIKWVPHIGRNAEIFVFAFHPGLDETTDHRDAAQWLFHIVAANNLPEAKSLSRPALARLAEPVAWEALASEVEAARLLLRQHHLDAAAES